MEMTLGIQWKSMTSTLRHGEHWSKALCAAFSFYHRACHKEWQCTTVLQREDRDRIENG